MNLRRFAMACVAAALPLASCAVAPRAGSGESDALTARAEAALERRGSGAGALSTIANVLRHEGPPPRAAPPVVRDLLWRPLAAADAAGLFNRSVPAAMLRLAADAAVEPPTRSAPATIGDLLVPYLDELARAQRVLKGATAGARVDAQALLRQLRVGLPTSAQLGGLAATVDPAAIERATAIFLDATSRFANALRAAGPALRFPAEATRFESAIGTVVIGTRGDDVHGPGAALIVDPGGNDRYTRAPATGGAVSVIVDLGGDDRYEGSDVAVHGLSAIVELSGNDSYTMKGPGLGAVITGAALIIDFAGDDSYEAALFGQGAAAFGFGAVLDLRGDDSYRLQAGGQGFAMTEGIGLLWDRGGNDSYLAAGLPDAYNRGGGVSMAQGAATGSRTALGGGIGLLRDDAGDDRYEAEMYAQGAGYYYGVGVLWDGGGDDRYRAVRYAQGAGVHEAVGVLRDDAGADRYELSVGVGQGMGLDLAVGVLYDGGGDDRYRSDNLAQGAATANGVGIAVDSGGVDEWHTGAGRLAWGRAEWSRGMPTTGLLLYNPARASFFSAGKPVQPAPLAAVLGGPFGGERVEQERPGERNCPTTSAAGGGLPLAEALRRAGPGLAGGAADPAAYADARAALTGNLGGSVGGLPRDDFDITWSLGEILRCVVVDATPGQATAMWSGMEDTLARDPASPFAYAFALALRERPAPDAQMQRLLQSLDAHPRCSVRAAALTLRQRTAAGEVALARVAALAQAALRSQCWWMQATAVTVLQRLEVAPDESAPLPAFLRKRPDSEAK